MNTQNFASLEASMRLVEAGIVLETEKVWFFSTTGWELVDRYDKHKVNKHYLPAPSMAEVWRELPDSTCINKDGDYTKCWVDSNMSLKVFQNENPTDALIDLLIFVRK